MTRAGITLTGVDQSTSPDKISQLLAMDEAVEIGFLFSAKPENRARYPDMIWLAGAMPLTAGRSALHVCGAAGRQMLADGQLDHLTRHTRRIQVNGSIAAGDFDPTWIQRICQQHPRHQIITQHHLGNVLLIEGIATNHALLVDGSGGRGIAPAAWRRPATYKPVGFAGGLGPENLADQLPRIIEAADDQPYWIDMESSLRNSKDQFDVTVAAAAIRLWQSHHLTLAAPRRHAAV